MRLTSILSLLMVWQCGSAGVVYMTKVEPQGEFVPARSLVWDFSNATILDGPVSAYFSNFGDSVIIESYPGLRLLYTGCADGICLASEENRHVRMDIGNDCKLSYIPTPDGDDSWQPYTAHGLYARRWPVAQFGKWRSSTTAPGTLIMCDGDTIGNVCCQSMTRRFTTECDSAANTPYVVTETTYCRWIKDDDCEPYAFMVQSKIIDGEGNSTSPLIRHAYLRLTDSDGSEAYGTEGESGDEIRLPSPAEAAAWLEQTSVEVSGRTVTAILPTGARDGVLPFIPVTLSITDESGILYSCRTATSADECISIDCTPLLSGHYLAVISIPDTESVTILKRLVLLF